MSEKTFDLGEVLAGRGYPSDFVDVYLDEDKAYELIKMQAELTKFEMLGMPKEYTALNTKLIAVLEEVKDRKLTFHLRGRTRRVYRDIAKLSMKKFPATKTLLGQVEGDPDRDEYHDSLTLLAMTDKIGLPGGGEIVFSHDYTDSGEPLPSELKTITDFRESAPESGLEAVEKKMEELQGAGVGFEIESQSPDFS